MLDLSTFKPIIGYDDYLIDENGEIYSKKSNKLLKPRESKDGYFKVNLCKHGKPKTLKVHRLVALTFIQNPDNLPQVNHKNGIKTDNRIENLEWVTASQNLKHAYDHGLKENCREAARRLGKIANKYAHEARIKHLDENLKELFDDIFINKLSNKNICQKYNLKHAYVSHIKNKRFFKVALNEYFGGSK